MSLSSSAMPGAMSKYAKGLTILLNVDQGLVEPNRAGGWVWLTFAHHLRLC